MGKVLFISPSTLDRKCLILTLVVCVLPTLFIGWMFFCGLTANNIHLIVIWGSTTVLFLSIFVLGVIITPYKYILTTSKLIIKRHYKDIVIPLQNIEIIRLMTDNDKKGTIRTFGAEGAFGSWGYYSTSMHKKVIVLARRYDNRTLIITDRSNYIIAPNDLQLVEATTQQIGKTETNIQTTPDIPTRNWRTIILIATMLPAILFIYLSYREPKVIFDSNAFKLKGIYGMNIPFAGITKVDTIAWCNMPAISLRTNGISLFKVHRGNFETTDGDKIRLSVNRGTNPVIRIVDQHGTMYYINRKSADEIRQIFDEIKNRITGTQ